MPELQKCDSVTNYLSIDEILNDEPKETICAVNNNTYDNPDFIPVSWNVNFTTVKYQDRTGERNGIQEHSCLLKEFNELFPVGTKRPVIKAIIPKKIQENMLCLLEHYGIDLKYNLVTGKIDLFYMGKKYNESLENATQTIWDYCEKHSFRLSKEKLVGLMVSLAWGNKYNPIQIYLEQCNYEMKLNDSTQKGKEELNRLIATLQTTLNYEEQSKYITKFLVQMVALAVCEENSNISGQYLLVLQGKQGIGKTTWFKNLIPEEMQYSYFLGGKSIDPTNKDHVLEAATNWLCEMGEISSTFRKADQEMLKAYITDYKDRVRPPYGKESIDKKRHTTLCGTTNDTEYLRDETGCRRFITIPCEKIRYNHDIDMDLVWGYVYELYATGEVVYYFTPEENAQITINNEQYKVKSDAQLNLEQFFNLFPEEGETINGFKNTSAEWLLSKEIGEFVHKNKGENEERLTNVAIGRVLRKIGVKAKKGANNTTLFFVEKIYSKDDLPF